MTALLSAVTSLDVPAEAAGVDRSVCARYDNGIRTGICVRDPKGGVYWLGTLAAYDGREIYCLDYGFATNWSVKHQTQVVSGSLGTSLGKTVGARTVAALNYLATRYPARSATNVTAASIQLIARQVMGDANSNGRGIPGGLRVSGTVRDVSFVPDAIVKGARMLWAEASVHRGPWSLAVSLSPAAKAAVSLGDTVTATVRGRNASGGGQDMTASLNYVGFQGPSSVRLGDDGVATVQLTAPSRAGVASVVASAEAAPSGKAVIVVPNRWQKNQRPGKKSDYSQRGLLANQPTARISATASTQVAKHVPTLVTQASAQTVQPGEPIYDSVAVAGTRGASGSFTWTLLGPVAPKPGGGCPGVNDSGWASAPVLASGVVLTSGDGVYLTPSYTPGPRDVGCLTYIETRPETSTTSAVSTPPGIPAETVLVTKPLATPCVSTVTSSQSANLGRRLHDLVKVGCIESTDRVVIDWTLHGPVSPRPGVSGKPGCNQIPVTTWRAAPVAASGRVTKVGPGQVKTAAFKVRRPGCYTYSESIAATATTNATATLPGIAAETSIITRPGLGGAPPIPTGPDADPSSRAGRKAGSLRIPSLNLRAPIRAVGIRRGTMAVPADPATLGWLRGTAAASDVIGSAVIAGHIANRNGRRGALATLGRVDRGAVVVWVDAAGRPHRYRVVAINRFPRARALPNSLVRTDREPVLRIVTCTRKVQVPGGYHYTHNLVVTARAIG